MAEWLKAHTCRHTGDLAPRTHNLVRLAESAGLAVTPEQADVFAETNEFALSGRYPDTTFAVPLLDEAEMHQRRAEGVFRWLIQPL